MNTIIKNIFIFLFFLLLIAGLSIFGDPIQPVKFNHNKHVDEMEMDCQECHLYVLSNRKATLPGKNVCLDCHSEQLGESTEEEKLVALLQSDKELKWKRVYVLPKHVYFSHFRHVTLGQIECQQCHGDMKLLTTPPKKPATDINDMDFCMDCHEERQVSNDCLACHN